jgi:hypothetical protein
MPAYEKKPMKGSMWVPDKPKVYETSCDYSGWIKVPPCSEEKEYYINVWDNRETKSSPRSPDFGIVLKDPAAAGKVPNGGTEELRSGQNSSYVPGSDNRAEEGDGYNW